MSNELRLIMDAILHGLEREQRFSLLGYYQRVTLLSINPSGIRFYFNDADAALYEMAQQETEEMAAYLAERFGFTMSVTNIGGEP